MDGIIKSEYSMNRIITLLSESILNQIIERCFKCCNVQAFTHDMDLRNEIEEDDAPKLFNYVYDLISRKKFPEK